MALTSMLFVVFATIHTISAAPGCESTSMMNCIMPMLGYFMGPDGKDLAVATDSMSFTDKQFGDFCRIGISFFDCAKDYFSRCATGAGDVQQFMAKTAQLVSRCNNPTFGSDARTLMQCLNTLNRTKAKTLACSNAASRWTMDDMRPLMPNKNGGRLDLQGWNSGAMLDSMCCNTKYYRQCSGSEINDKCGPQAQQVFNSLQEAVLVAYDCNTRKTTCPARPDPSPEDYTAKMDFTSLLAGGAGGMSTSQRVKTQGNSSNLIHASYVTVGLLLLFKAVFSA